MTGKIEAIQINTCRYKTDLIGLLLLPLLHIRLVLKKFASFGENYWLGTFLRIKLIIRDLQVHWLQPLEVE